MQHRVDPILDLRLHAHQAHAIAQPFPRVPHLRWGQPYLPPPDGSSERRSASVRLDLAIPRAWRQPATFALLAK